MTFWHNSTTGDGKAFWASTVADFEAANPNVKINVQAIQNEDMDGKLQTALNSGAPPDIFMARGGGKLADIVDADQVMDLTDSLDPATKAAVSEGVLNAFTVDGKLYGMPTAVLPGGMYYSKDLFKKAGITATPKTIGELSAAVDKLKGADVEPIALGAKDAWPAAHYYYFFALRDCSKATMDAAAKDKTFSDPCWTKAGEDLQAFARRRPVQQGLPDHLGAAGRRLVGRPAGQPQGRDGADGRLGAGRDRLPHPGPEAAVRPRLVPVPRGRRRAG